MKHQDASIKQLLDFYDISVTEIAKVAHTSRDWIYRDGLQNKHPTEYNQPYQRKARLAVEGAISLILQNRQAASNDIKPFSSVSVLSFKHHNFLPIFDKISSIVDSAGLQHDRIIVEECDIADIWKCIKNSDVLIMIGGDGSLLRLARLLEGYDIPIITVNAGKVGFLSSMEKEDIDTELVRILHGHYISIKRPMLQATTLSLPQKNKYLKRFCLNEVVVHTHPTMRVMDFDVFIDDNFACSYRSDGIIFSTPTGSTAYALSAGGAILDPNLDVIELVPINAYRPLSNRAIIVPACSTIRVVPHFLEKYKNIAITCDGQQYDKISSNNEVTIRKSTRYIRSLHKPQYSMYTTFFNKLN